MTQMEYEQTSYYGETGYAWDSVLKDQGKLGEFKTFQSLKSFEKEGCKFLFNVYVPKGKGKTSECDVLLLTPRGIVAIESKNYSGWIFGEQSSRKWMEIHNAESKHQFYNPVWQNTTHINSLKAQLRYPKFPIWNVIAFSDECEFKQLKITDSEVHVVHYQDLNSLVKAFLNETSDCMDVDSIYSQLKQFSHPDEETKSKHDEDVKKAQGKREAGYSNVRPSASDSSQDAYTHVSATPQNTKTRASKAKYIAIAAVAFLILLGALLGQNSPPTQNVSVTTTAPAETTLRDNQVAFYYDGGQTVATVDSVEFGYSDSGKKIVTVTGTYENVSVAAGLNFDFNNGLEHLAVTDQSGIPLMHETWFKDANTKLLPGSKITIAESFQVEDDDTEVVVRFVYPNNHGIRQGEFRYPVT